MTDADLLREVFAIATANGLQVTRVKCGSIELIATPMRSPGDHKPAEAKTGLEEVRDLSEVKDEKALPELRRRSKETFGFVKSDSVLLAMKGAL